MGSDGNVYQPRSRATIEANLQSIARTIKIQNADVVLLQEVDFGSRRSHDIEQAKWLAEATDLGHIARAVTWDRAYVPYPYWPPQHHFGRILSGGAVLSRFPITKNEVTLLPKPESKSWLYRYFYLHRFFQKIEVPMTQGVASFINVHLEAFFPENRQLHAELLKKEIEATRAPLLVAGDFNAPPSYAKLRGPFPDNSDDYRTDKSFDVLAKMGSLSTILSQEDYLMNEAANWTFPSNKPNRRLDHAYVTKEWNLMETRVLATGEASDHLPLLMTLTARLGK